MHGLFYFIHTNVITCFDNTMNSRGNLLPHQVFYFFGRIRSLAKTFDHLCGLHYLVFLLPKKTLLNAVFIIPLLFKNEIVFLNF